MTVKELIEELMNYPENMPVRIEATYDYGYGSTSGNIQYVEKDKYDYFLVIGTEEG